MIWFSSALHAGWLWEETKVPLKSLPEMGRVHLHSAGVSRRPLAELGLSQSPFLEDLLNRGEAGTRL